MARCFSCHADSCNRRKICTCSCHNEERLQNELKNKVLAEKLAVLDEASKCPKCRHPLGDHNAESPGSRYQCYERMSNDNNDFCGCEYGKPTPEPQEPILLYAIRNEKGEWFLPYSRGSAASWQPELIHAKIYTKQGAAQGKITALANEDAAWCMLHPSAKPKPIPELVEFTVVETRVIDQKDRVAKAKQKKIEENIQREIANKQYAVKCAEEQLQKAHAQLKKLRGETK